MDSMGRFGQQPGKGLGVRNAGKNLPHTKAKTAKLGGLRSYGPAELGLNVVTENLVGPMAFINAHPELFATGTTSAPEGFIYWALTKLLGPEDYSTWTYQASVLNGRHSPGGAVVDFVVYLPNVTLGFRIQTYRFHEDAPVSKRIYDVEQLIAIFRADFMVIDIFEQDFLYDETGQAAIKVVLEALSNLQRPDPIATGLTVGSG